MLSLQSKSAGLAVIVGKIVICQKEKARAEIARHLSWIEFITTDKPVFVGSGIANWAIRVIQLLVAIETPSRFDVRLVEAVESELTRARLGANFIVPRFGALVMALQAIRIEMTPAKLVSLIGEVIRLTDKLHSHSQGKDLEFKVFGKMVAFRVLIFGLVAARVDSVSFLNQFVAAIRSTSPELLEHFRAFFKDIPWMARGLVDHAWLANEAKTTDWDAVARNLEGIIELAHESQLTELADQALRALMIVCDEYLDDPTGALSKLAQHRPHSPSFLLRDEEATVLLHQENNNEALAIWETILSEQQGYDEAEALPSAFSHRKAAIAAENLGLWKRAAEILSLGAGIAARASDKVLKVGLLADSGYAHWRAGENTAARVQLTAALTGLVKLPNTKDELKAFKLSKTVGQTLIHIFNQVEGGNMEADAYSLPPAFCSDPSVNDKIRSLPESDSRLLWIFLALIEVHLRLTPVVYKQVRSRLGKSDYIPIRFFLEQVTLARIIFDGPFRQVPIASENLARVYRIAKAQIDPKAASLATLKKANFGLPAVADDFEIAAHGLYAALVIEFSRDKLRSLKFDRWKRSSSPLAIRDEVSSWIDEAEAQIMSSPSEAMLSLKDGSGSFWRRSFAALNVASSDSISSEELLYSQVTIVSALLDNPLQRFIGVELGEHFSKQWMSRVEFTASLRTPRLAVPIIKKACSEHAPGMRWPSRILIAVEPAVSLGIPASLRERLLGLTGLGNLQPEK